MLEILSPGIKAIGTLNVRHLESLAARVVGGSAPPLLGREARQALLRHGWPGNTRELRNVMERLALLAAGREVLPEDLPPALRDGGAAVEEGRVLTLAELEAAHIRKVLSMGLNMDSAAEMLGIATVTLWRKRKELGLD